MTTRTPAVGRSAERAHLGEALARAREGAGAVVLLAGEAGIGKTRLVEDVAEEGGVRLLRGRADGEGVPYAALAGPLREHLRARPGGLDALGPLLPPLAVVLPELGAPPERADAGTLVEALRAGLAEVASEGPAVLLLDDLHRSDEATLELLARLGGAPLDMPLVAVAAYRPEGLSRDHGLRRLRHELRRAGRLDEVALGPLDAAGTAELVRVVAGDAPSPALARALHDRAQGVPFFVEELARALQVAGALVAGPGGVELAPDGEVPVPDTVRDAVLMAAAELSPRAREAADAAAVAGGAFDPELVAEVAGEEGLSELVEQGWVREEGDGRAAFRHALAREALYADVPWLRRRALHRALATTLEAAGAPGAEVAPHWLGARDATRARPALLRAAEELRAVHAYRDAARAGRQALDLWPEGEQAEERLATLASYATSAELAGELAEAARAWREACDLLVGPGPDHGVRRAEALRRLAGVHDLRGDREGALSARRAAAEAFAAAGRPADAALERIGAANYLRARAEYTPAVELAQAAQREAAQAGRDDVHARALGLEGVLLAKRGDHAEGLATVRRALGLALDAGLTPVAAELYQRLSLVIYDAGDYRSAERTLDTALELCSAGDQPDVAVACVTCMVYVLRECGEWGRALELGRQVVADGPGAWVAEGLMGAIHAYQGRLGTARRLLRASLAVSARVDHFNMAVDSTAALGRVAAAEGAADEAAARCREILARWEASEDHHYALRGLRWSAAFLARGGDVRTAHRCAEALTAIAARTGHPDALAALAHAIAETALAEGDAVTAAEQLGRALELHQGIDVPFERAEIALRAGVAIAAAGDREAGLARLDEAYRTARRLGARPLAAEAAREVAALGEPVGSRLGRRAEADADGGGLSRRELEVVRLVAQGRTNREIAGELYLSPRTVDMHVRSILRRLGCRSRIDAARRAGELGLL